LVFTSGIPKINLQGLTKKFIYFTIDENKREMQVKR